MRAPGQKSSLKVWALAEMSAEGGLSGPPRVDLSFFRSGDAEAAAAAAADMPADGFFFAPRRFAGIPLIPSLQAREIVERRTQDGQPSVQADREGSFGLPRRRGAIYARGCQGHKGGTRGQILSARYARATTLARVCGGGRQRWRWPDCRAPYLPSCLLYTSPSPRDQRGSRMPSSA